MIVYAKWQNFSLDYRSGPATPRVMLICLLGFYFLKTKLHQSSFSLLSRSIMTLYHLAVKPTNGFLQIPNPESTKWIAFINQRVTYNLLTPV